MKHLRFHRPCGLFAALSTCALVVAAPTLLSGCGGAGTSLPTKGAPDVKAIIEQARRESGTPAIGAAYITTEGTITQVIGIRKVGASVSVTPADRFHLASCSKAMLATLVGRLVEQGKISLGLTVSQAFPSFADTINAGFKDVTLRQLLAHRGGATAFESDPAEFAVLPTFSGTTAQKRQAFARFLLSRPPATPVGEFHYSNGGYAIAGAMLEARTRRSYEESLQSELFGPLGTSISFGFPARGGAAQPWGHSEEGGVYTPADPNETLPANDVLSASGDANLNVNDWARFVQLHLKGLRGQNDLLRASTIQLLHQPVGGAGSPYALGWYEANLDGVPTTYHAGTVGTFFAVAVIQPTRNRGAVVVANALGAKSGDAVFNSVERLLSIKIPAELRD